MRLGFSSIMRTATSHSRGASSMHWWMSPWMPLYGSTPPSGWCSLRQVFTLQEAHVSSFIVFCRPASRACRAGHDICVALNHPLRSRRENSSTGHGGNVTAYWSPSASPCLRRRQGWRLKEPERREAGLRSRFIFGCCSSTVRPLVYDYLLWQSRAVVDKATILHLRRHGAAKAGTVIAVSQPPDYAIGQHTGRMNWRPCSTAHGARKNGIRQATPAAN